MIMMMIRIMVMTVMSVTQASSLDCGRRHGWFTCNNTDPGSHTTCLAPAQVCDGRKVKQKPYFVVKNDNRCRILDTFLK